MRYVPSQCIGFIFRRMELVSSSLSNILSPPDNEWDQVINHILDVIQGSSDNGNSVNLDKAKILNSRELFEVKTGIDKKLLVGKVGIHINHRGYDAKTVEFVYLTTKGKRICAKASLYAGIGTCISLLENQYSHDEWEGKTCSMKTKARLLKVVEPSLRASVVLNRLASVEVLERITPRQYKKG